MAAFREALPPDGTDSDARPGAAVEVIDAGMVHVDVTVADRSADEMTDVEMTDVDVTVVDGTDVHIGDATDVHIGDVDVTDVTDRAMVDGTIPQQDPPAALSSLYGMLIKPALDRVGAAIALVLAAPVMVVVALAIRTRLGRGVIFRQERVGRGGRPFTIYKFRTMRPDRRRADRAYDGPDRRVCHKREDDPRHTPLGRALRNARLDELPQLYNVLKGDMSLVGPRPELVSVVNAHYQPWQLRRHLVKPGLTGLWQVSEQRSWLIYENTAPDLRYVETVSFSTDASIVARTLPALLRRGR